MNSCVIKDRKFRKLQEMTGIGDVPLSVNIATYNDIHGRFPEVDEIYGSDSMPAMIKNFELKEYDGNYKTNSSNLNISSRDEEPEISSVINREYRDYETRVLFNGRNSIVIPKKRPIYDNVDIDLSISNTSGIPDASRKTILMNMIAKMNNIYGMNIRTFNNDTVDDIEFIKDNKSMYLGKNAFIHNGTIYVNTDIADIDAPLHEMMHIILGEMKFNDAELYMQLVSQAVMFPSWEYMRKMKFNNMAIDDALEEVFVQEVSRYMSGLESSIDGMKRSEKSKIKYNIMRMVDSMVFGDASVQSIGFNTMSAMSLSSICNTLGSAISQRKDKLDLSSSEKHRMLANKKTELIKRGLLKEICK